jgi:uncharacterized protein (DUF2237 family)
MMSPLTGKLCWPTLSLSNRNENAMPANDNKEDDLNVFGESLRPCSEDPVTGFYRNGCCSTGEEDRGRHVVCVEMTASFLEFSKRRGNDLSTPRPEFGFPGLRPGDRWCLCADRWQEALEAGAAPRVVLGSTHRRALEHVDLADLKRYALDLS